jgi:hypothetical protein
MKVRTTIAGTALRARLTVLCWGALTLLAPVAVSACSGSSTTPTVPTFTPSVATPGTATGSATAPASSGNSASSGVTPSSTNTTASGTPGVSSSSLTATPKATVTETVTAPAISSTSQVPVAAPPTGGGGTAGLQDGLLFGLGAAAILAGAGSIVYRRRLTRHH